MWCTSTRPSIPCSRPPRSIAASSPPADRRCVFRNVRGADFPLVTNLFGTARRAELAFGDAAAAADQAPRRSGRDDAAADAGQALGRARRRPRTAQGRAEARRRRPGHRGRHRRRAPRSAAGDDHVAGRRRTVHHAAARVHAASRWARTQPRHVSPAGATTQRTHGHALADRQGRRLPLSGRRSARTGRCR